MIATLVWLAFAAPLAGVVLIALGADRIPRRLASLVGCASILASFGLFVAAFVGLWDRPADDRSVSDALWTWLSTGDFTVDMDIAYDPLAAVMTLVVTGVGFLIHVYSVGYMHGDPEERRFFAYLNLFVFSMLLLVLAGNFVLLLAGWGLVGLSSYLLIGFWHRRPSAIAAAKKAFIMNAVGDVGLMLGIFLLFREVGAVDYGTVFAAAEGIDRGTMGWICALLLVGALAKSAQLPLHTWLPDAMEGPTPVSALIHAATMVTAGVYLVARMHPLFGRAPEVSDAIVVIGAVGVLMAGLIALAQNDIKRVIAYSTMSQIAYMFMAVGLAQYAAGIFHLMTHAFFKALLFMAAGVVIHALHDEQDIRRMGGLRRYLPRTHVLFWIGALALCGVFPLSGGFSKDAIISGGVDTGGWVGWTAAIVGVAGAFVTALYTFRLLHRVFSGEPSTYAARTAPAHTAHGEGPSSMVWPLYVLAFLAATAGVVAIPGLTHVLPDWLETVWPDAPGAPAAGTEWLVTAVTTSVALSGIVIATALWGRGQEAGAWFTAGPGRPLYEAASHRFYWDALYHYVFEVPTQWAAAFGRRFIERPVFLLPVGAVGVAARGVARGLGLSQTGVVRTYAIAFALGVGALLLYFLLQAA